MTRTLLFLLLALATIACQPRVPLVLVVPAIVGPGPLTHYIGGWADADIVCVGVPVLQAVYVKRQCVSMGAIRTLILTAQVADHQEPAR